jgi:hypothetical protein
VLLSLSHAFIQLQSVCASLELHTSHSRVSTVVYVSTFYKSLFGSPSADLVFGSPRPSADTSEGPYAVEVIFESSGTSCCREGKQNLFLFFALQFFVKFEVFFSFSETSRILRSLVTWCSIGIRLCT